MSAPRTRTFFSIMWIPASPSGRIHLRAFPLAFCYALFTLISTTCGVLLVLHFRPSRKRMFPFYSDATQHDPERTILGLLQNVACFLGPPTCMFEHLFHTSYASIHPLPYLPKLSVLHTLSTHHVSLIHLYTSLFTTLAFFLTANLPTIRPFIPAHQLAASLLLVLFFLQALCKLILAVTLSRQETMGWIGKYHVKIRIFILMHLFVSLLVIHVSFVLRHTLPSKHWLHSVLVAIMAITLYSTTIVCCVHILLIAIQLRHVTLHLTIHSNTTTTTSSIDTTCVTNSILP